MRGRHRASRLCRAGHHRMRANGNFRGHPVWMPYPHLEFWPLYSCIRKGHVQ